MKVTHGQQVNLGERLHLSQSGVGSTTSTCRLLSIHTDATLKVIARGFQRIVDGLLVLG